MNKIFIVTALALLHLPALSQSCGDYPFFRNGKQFTFESTLLGKDTKITYQTDSLTNDAGGLWVSIKFVGASPALPDQMKKDFGSFLTRVGCKNGTIIFNFRANIGKGSYDIAYTFPAGMSVGQTLPDITVNIPSQNLSEVLHRKVLAYERVTTPGGAWSAYKIEETSDVTIGGKKSPYGNIVVDQWFVPGVGLVQSAINGKINSTLYSL